MTRYPNDINATTLVYLRESRRRRNDRGITTSLGSNRSAMVERSKHDHPQHSHECSNPEMPLNQKSNAPSILIETSDHTWHQVPNNYKIANPDTKTFDRNGRVEYDGCIWICDLRKSKEGSGAAV